MPRLPNEAQPASDNRMNVLVPCQSPHTSGFQRRSVWCSAGAGSEPILDAAEFDVLRAKLAPLREQLKTEVAASEQQRTTLIESRVEPVRSLREAEAELRILMQRQGNLPPEYIEMRRRLCDELRLIERDLPFAAELIAVKPDQRDWEGSIEMVLRSFALSLLVPQRHYNVVSRYFERTSLRDAHGRGQKLVYLQVAERERQVSGPMPEARSLFRKLDFRRRTRTCIVIGRPLA